MATRNIDKGKKISGEKKKPASPNAMIKGKADKTELTEDDLKEVSGGPIYMDKY